MTARMHRPLLCTLLAFVAGCASQRVRRAQLPFHVAVVPVAIEATGNGGADGSAPDLLLAFDSDGMTRRLVGTLQDSFVAVTPLAAPEGAGDADAWLRQARALGADLVVDATLRYDPQLTTSLNDRFWLNLPLFALGSPATWFVADRSYHCMARLQTQLYDLALASSPSVNALDATSHLLRIERQVDEASLSLFERGNTGHFLLSLLVPAGFTGPASASVPTQVREVVEHGLCDALSAALVERREELEQIARVDFRAEGVRVEQTARGRELVGEFVLQLGNVTELGELRYRRDEEPMAVLPWGEVVVERQTARGRGKKHYPFRIPVGTATTVHLEVEQQDRLANRRSFTYRVAAVERRDAGS